MFYSNHNKVENEHFTNFDNFSNRSKLCLIVSSIDGPNNPNWLNSNYQKRHNLVQKLLNSDLEFDFYGRGWTGISDKRYKGSFEDKHQILRNYEYSICVENVNENNYASEKIFDCFLNNTVPLYYGCPNIAEFYDKRSFETIDITDPDIVNIIKNKIKINSSTYREAILNSKQTYFDRFNLFNLMQEISQ
jgi:hypothetical protein